LNVGKAICWQQAFRKIMYKSFLGLKENPFNVNPDPRYLFMTKRIEEALSGLM
jgi:hypothetical protein